VRPDILFPAYLAGFNLAESFYLALPSLSWHAIVVGDPLCRPFTGKVMTRADIEADLDADTNLPGLFAKRRIAHAVAATPDIPQRAVVLGLRAETLIARGDLDGARQALSEAIGIAPKVPAWLLLLASADMSAGNVDGAIAHYRSVLKLQPDNVVALNDLAYTLAVRRNAPAEALPFAKRAASLAPRFGTVLDTWGWIEHLLGNHTAAARILDDAIKVDPGLAELRLHAAVVAAALGNTQRAAAELGEALRLNPALEDREEARTVREQIARGGRER
jgi:tetratricopeptide (TPR) repeat protein